jgi:hypothetical protein
MNARVLYDLAVLNLHRHEKNFDLQLPSGLVLRGCSLHVKNGHWWIGLPARAYTTADGSQSWAAIVDLARDEFDCVFASPCDEQPRHSLAATQETIAPSLAKLSVAAIPAAQ